MIRRAGVVSEDMHTDEEAPGSPKAGNTSNTVNKNAPSKLTDTQLILQKMAEFKADITQQRLADKAEMKAEIQTLTAKIEAPILSSEDEEPEQPKAQGKDSDETPDIVIRQAHKTGTILVRHPGDSGHLAECSGPHCTVERGWCDSSTGSGHTGS